MIVETCPRCEHNLVSFVLTCYPPVPKKYCPCCGWTWTGEPEAVRYVPVQLSNYGYDSSPCRTCPNNPANGGSGICLCTLGQPEIRW